jgi:acetamidase/formamidase
VPVTSHHYGWSRDHEPCVTVRPGAVVEFEMADPSDGQLSPASTAADIAGLDDDRIPPLFGPVAVEGAAPGDVVQVTVLEAAPGSWGWTAVLPGFGLLADEFSAPALHLWDLSAGAESAEFAPGIAVPLKPFPGEIGLAPAAAGLHSAVNPRRVGGNLDVRDLAAGSTLLLPVEVAGGLFSCGDGHAAQGDGELCGTAIECPLRLAVRIDLVRAAPLSAPRFSTPGPVTRHLDAAGYDVTTGLGPDLMEAARDAARAMLDLLVATRGLTRADAYMLCSVCADLRLSQVVDAPDWVVSLYFPRAVFAGLTPPRRARARDARRAGR